MKWGRSAAASSLLKVLSAVDVGGVEREFGGVIEGEGGKVWLVRLDWFAIEKRHNRAG